MDAKPLGCRVFPFQIAPTFKDEFTVAGRFDCPAVRKNQGTPYSDEISNLNRYASQLSKPAGFDDATLCFLDRDQIQAVVEFLATLMNAFDTAEQRALFLSTFCDRLALVGPDELDRPLLAQLFPELKEYVFHLISNVPRPPNAFARLVFRTLLGLYLRRDEDVLAGRASRVGRAFALTRVVLGRGNLHSLGLSHPGAKLRAAHLFCPPHQSRRASDFDLLWRLVRNRLESYQFLGPANGNRDLLSGLRSLALLYPLTLAVAKYSAAARKGSQPDARDIDYAITAIEHSFARLPILAQPWARSLESFLLRPDIFPRLVQTI